MKFRHLERRGGFTLLELMAVMALVALLSTLAVTSYFSAVRGMARRSANEHFLNTLTQARQRALIDGTKVSVIAYREVIGYDGSGNPNKIATSYVVCREIGRITFVKGGQYLFDEYSDLKMLFGTKSGGISSDEDDTSIRLYNLSQGSWTMVKSLVSLQQFGGGNVDLWATTLSGYDKHNFRDYALEMLPGETSLGAQSWKVGDAYGIAVAPPINLPKTFYFEGLEEDAGSSTAEKKVLYVTFDARGYSVDQYNRGRSVSFTIRSSDPTSAPGRYSISNQGVISAN